MAGSDKLGGVELQMTTQLGRAGSAGRCHPVGPALKSVHMQPTRACADAFTLAYIVQEHTHRRSSCAENILFTP